MSLAPGTRLGSYEIATQIGQGGMGAVYRATDTNLGRQVAIKVLPDAFAQDTERLARFEREAKTLASLNHPNIAQIFAVEKSAGITALVMELVEGDDLSQRIARGAVPVDEALPIARQIAEALEAAHEQGIIHRDLKPANIKVRSDGGVKVLDFGLAKAMEPGGGSSPNMSKSPTITTPAMTMAGVILGTAAYMSPEQARGRPVDKRADIWAFGCVLFEMLTGTPPFHGSDLTDTLASVVKDQPDLSQAPALVRRLLARCLEKDPGRRLRDLGDAWDLLEDEERAGAPSVAAAQERRRWPLALGVGAAASMLAFGAAWMIAGRPAPAPPVVQRFTVTLPDEAATLHSLAISPDGRYLAIAISIDGIQRLWLRPLDSFEARPVAASDGATFPFWSPDSRFVAFFADGKLRRAAVAGGPPTVICDAANGRGGSWSRDGLIVFAPVPGTIQRVAATGGAPVDVAKVVAAARFPTFLPDGQHFLYLAGRSSPDQDGIRLASLDGTEDRRLLPDYSTFSVAGGRLVFNRTGTLLEQRIDTENGRLAGDAVSIVDGVPFASVQAYTPVTMSDSGVLVYAGGVEGALSRRQLTWYDRDGKRLGTLGAPGSVLDPVLSPDGSRVIFMRRSASGLALWIRALDRDVEQRFTPDTVVGMMEPIWSPRGDRIVFGAGRDLMEKSADGGGVAQALLPGGEEKSPTDWSRDGQFLVFTAFGAQTRSDIWRMAIDSPGDKPRPFLQSAASEHHARLSPDGRWVAYASDESGRDEVYVRRFPSGDGQWQISATGGTEPRWRGDGTELFFIAADGNMMATSVAADTGGARPEFRPRSSRRLFDTHVHTLSPNQPVWSYDVTSDGMRFLVASSIDSSTALNVVVNWDAELRK